MEGSVADPMQDGLFSIFDRLGPALDDIARISLNRGETLIEQGSAAGEMFLVQTGRLQVLRDGAELAEIGPGQVVGEIAFFTGEARTADVIAARDSVVLKLTRAEYDALCTAHPDLPQSIARDLARRLAETSAKVTAKPAPPLARTVTLLPVGTEGLDPTFVTALTDALSRLTTTRTITRDHAARALDADPKGAAAATWFNAQERAGGIVAYVADPDDTEWSEQVLRQADQVLLIGHAGAVPALSKLESFALSLLPESHRRLVLIHPERSAWVSGTEDWLDSRPVFMHHHTTLGADMGADDDIDRIARFLTGRAVGLVAAGGGALGALHTGIYEGLRRRGVTFDIFGGTSVGSAMAGAFAMGLTGDDINAQTGEMFVTHKALARLTVPKYGLLDHTHFDHYLRKHYTEGLVENLWVPYFALATDLSENAQRVIRRGPLWQAIRASAAIPAALPPFYDAEGSMLVDGGSMDNLPYRVMHRLKSGPNVVISFQRDGRQSFRVAYDKLPGRGPLLRRTLFRFGKRPPRAPGMVSVLMRSLLARQAGDALDLEADDWLIRPPVPKGTGFMDWKSHAKLYSVGLDTVDNLLDEPGAEDDARRHFIA